MAIVKKSEAAQPAKQPEAKVENPAVATSSTQAAPAVEATAHGDESYTQKCIRRSGLVQAAMGSPGVAAYSTNWEDFKVKAKELALEMLKVVENH